MSRNRKVEIRSGSGENLHSVSCPNLSNEAELWLSLDQQKRKNRLNTETTSLLHQQVVLEKRKQLLQKRALGAETVQPTSYDTPSMVQTKLMHSLIQQRQYQAKIQHDRSKLNLLQHLGTRINRKHKQNAIVSSQGSSSGGGGGWGASDGGLDEVEEVDGERHAFALKSSSSENVGFFLTDGAAENEPTEREQLVSTYARSLQVGRA